MTFPTVWPAGSRADSRATLFTMRGSGGALAQTALLGNPIGNYDVMIGQAVDKTRWRVHPVEYLGGMIGLCNTFTVGDGVDKLVAAINATPGKFAFAGMSQGAIVASRVYKRIKDPAGDLHHRNADFLGGVMCGNPEREAGHTIPGGIGPAVPLHGLADEDGLTGSEARWWDFSDPDDIFSSIADDTQGDLQSRVYEFVMLNWTGEGAIEEFITQLEGWASLAPTAQAQALALAGFMQYILPSTLSLIGLWNPSVNTFGHLRYHLPYTGLAGNTTKSAVTLAAEHLNAIAPAPVAPPTRQLSGRVGDQRSQDPVAAWNFINSKRIAIDEECRQPSLYRLMDKNLNYIGTVKTHKAFDAEQIQHDTGTGKVVLRGSDWLVNFLRTDVRAEEDLNFIVDPYPHRRNWRRRWGFKVIDVAVGRSEDGEVTVTLEIAENREHWKHILLGATIFAPPEAQVIKCFLLPANCRTAVTTTGAANLARLFNPALAVFTNLLNPQAWVGAVNNLATGWSMLSHPLQMQFVNPVTDTSRTTVLMSRWQDAHSVTEQMLRDAGCHLRTYVWLEEDEDSPHPELAMLVGEQLARPTRNCIILACEEKAQYAGVTGLAPDGAIKMITASADDLITNNVIPEYDENGDGVTDPLIRKWFGAAPKPPSLIFRDGERSAIISSEHHMYKSKAKTIMSGGKSPQWLNQVQTFLIRYAISKIAEAIISFPSSGAPAQLTGTEGLENVYQNQADDMFFSFIRYTDVNRELRSGDFGFLEEFVQGSGSAYVISSPLTIREGLDKTKPRHVFKTEVRNARPHRVFIDFDMGDPALFEIDGILSQDHISAIGLHEDETTAKMFKISIGDDREADSGLARVTRTAQEFWNGLGMLFGQGTNF